MLHIVTKQSTWLIHIEAQLKLDLYSNNSRSLLATLIVTCDHSNIRREVLRIIKATPYIAFLRIYILLNTEIRTVTSVIIHFMSYFTVLQFPLLLRLARKPGEKEFIITLLFITARFIVVRGKNIITCFMGHSGSSLTGRI